MHACVQVCAIRLAYHDNGSQIALMKVCMSGQGGTLYQDKEEDDCAHTEMVHMVSCPVHSPEGSLRPFSFRMNVKLVVTLSFFHVDCCLL